MSYSSGTSKTAEFINFFFYFMTQFTYIIEM